MPPGELRSPYYIHVEVDDRPGVLAHVAERLAAHEVSVARLDPAPDQRDGPACTSSRTRRAGARVEDALAEIRALPETQGHPTVLPVISQRGVAGPRLDLMPALAVRFRDRLPVGDGTPLVSLGEGGTPLVHAPRLSERLGVELWLKFEGANPTGSFKDRGMAIAVAQALEDGAAGGDLRVDRQHRRIGRRLRGAGRLACGRARPGRRGRCRQALPGGRRRRAGCSRCAAPSTRRSRPRSELAERGEYVLVNSLNPDRVEGQKTAAFEIVEELGVAGRARAPVRRRRQHVRVRAGLRGERGGMPRIVAGEAVGSRRHRGLRDPDREAGARGRLPRRRSTAAAVRVVSLADDEIRDAWQLLAESEGVFAELVVRGRAGGARTRGSGSGVRAVVRAHGPRPQGPAAHLPVDDRSGRSRSGCDRTRRRGERPAEVHVRAPATTANIGPGFDCAGAALDLWNELELRPSDGSGDEPADRSHLGVRAFERLVPSVGWSFRFTDRIPQARGLGSSAAVDRARARRRRDRRQAGAHPDELLALGLQLEGHGDNLAAALAGGVCLTWGTRIARIADTAPATDRSRPQPPCRDRGLAGGAAGHRPACRRGLLGGDARRCSAPRSRATRPTSSRRRSKTGCTSRIAPRAPAPRRAFALDPLPGALGVTLSGAGPTVIVWARNGEADACADGASRTLSERAGPSTHDLADRSRTHMSETPYDRPSDPAKRHSAALTDGADRAPARAMLKAIGFTDEDLARPLVGVATTWIETMPCNLNQRELAQHVKRGIRAAGGTPMEFNTIAVSDGVSMGTEGMRASLVSREVIADSIELVARGHMFDGLVCLVGCDKTIPAAAMALARLDIPGLALYNGSIAPGRFKGGDVTIQDVFEAVGAHAAGKMSDEEVHAARGRRLPRRRRVRRAVHGEHDGDRDRLPRHLAGRAQRHPGARTRQGGGRRTRRAAGDGARPRRRAPFADHHARGARERGGAVAATRRLDERRAAPARDRAGARHPVRRSRTSTRSPRGRRSSPTSSRAAATSPPTCTRRAASRSSRASC